VEIVEGDARVIFSIDESMGLQPQAEVGAIVHDGFPQPPRGGAWVGGARGCWNDKEVPRSTARFSR